MNSNQDRNTFGDSNNMNSRTNEGDFTPQADGTRHGGGDFDSSRRTDDNFGGSNDIDVGTRTNQGEFGSQVDSSRQGGGAFDSSRTNNDGGFNDNSDSTGFGSGNTQGAHGHGRDADAAKLGGMGGDSSAVGGFGDKTSQNRRTGDTFGNTDNNSGSSGNAGIGSGRTADDFGSTGASNRDHTTSDHATSGKPGVGDKIRGTAETMTGKMTKNPGLVEKGQERKTGDVNNNNTF